MVQKSSRRAYVCGYLTSAWKGVGDADDISAVDRISVATQSLNHEDVPSGERCKILMYLRDRTSFWRS
jgi:hypothetical protein